MKTALFDYYEEWYPECKLPSIPYWQEPDFYYPYTGVRDTN